MRSRIFNISFAVAAVLILGINLFFGTYFEDYEVLVASFLLHEFITPIDYSNNAGTNVWFMLTPILSFFSDFFYGIHFYSLLTNFINFIFLFSLVYFTLSIAKKQKIKKTIFLILLVTVVIIGVQNVILISNRRLAINLLLPSMIFLVLYFEEYQMKKSVFFTSAFLFALSVFLRFEIVLMSLLIFSPLYIVYRNNKFWKVYLFYFSFSLLVFFSFKILQSTVYSNSAVFEKIEHEFIDRESIYFDNEISDMKAYKLYAMMLFVKDELVFGKKDYEQLYDSVNYRKYILKPGLLDFWGEKVYNLYKELNIYFIGFYLLFVLVFWSYTKRHLLGFFNIGILLLPFAISFFLILPAALYESIIVACSLGMLFLSLDKNIGTNYYIGILLVALPLFILSLLKTHRDQTAYQVLYDNYRQDLDAYVLDEKKVVFANLVNDFANYPRRTFVLSPKNKREHFYLDLFFYNNYSYYKNHHKKLFKNDLPFLNKRILICADKDVVFYANEQQRSFLTKYLAYYHNMSIEFIPLQSTLKKNASRLDLDPSIPFKLNVN
tara:strand:- start:27683 stop:29329 length:1647 start_codon:yes stop_codon:yes gene_type:complete